MKKWLLFTFLIIAGSVLTGCKYADLEYQGTVRPVEEVEEMLADYLESENPDYDITVDIIVD